MVRAFDKSSEVREIAKNMSSAEIVNYDWDKVAFGFSTGDVIEIPLKDLKVKYLGDMDNVRGFNMREYFRNSEYSDLPPIEVSYKDGAFSIEDGHHRYGYAKELKLDRVPVLIESIKDNPILALGFDSIDDIIKMN